MTRAKQRIATASAALLVQAVLVGLFAWSVTPGTPRQQTDEITLSLRPMLRTVSIRPAPVPPRVPRMIAPQAQAALPPMLDERAIVAAAAAPPPSALEGIGRALFGCAPERFGQLTGPEQLRCPAPGQGAARMAATDLAPKSHSRDALLWAEGLAARQFAQPCEEGANTPGNTRVGRCVMGQTLAQSLRARQVKAEYDFDRTRRGARAPEPIWVGLVPPKR